jgi:hypothetical protein
MATLPSPWGEYPGERDLFSRIKGVLMGLGRPRASGERVCVRVNKARYWDRGSISEPPLPGWVGQKERKYHWSPWFGWSVPPRHPDGL